MCIVLFHSDTGATPLLEHSREEKEWCLQKYFEKHLECKSAEVFCRDTGLDAKIFNQVWLTNKFRYDNINKCERHIDSKPN